MRTWTKYILVVCSSFLLPSSIALSFLPPYSLHFLYILSLFPMHFLSRDFLSFRFLPSLLPPAPLSFIYKYKPLRELSIEFTNELHDSHGFCKWTTARINSWLWKARSLLGRLGVWFRLCICSIKGQKTVFTLRVSITRSRDFYVVIESCIQSAK